MADRISQYLGAIEGATIKEVEFETFWIVSQYAGSPSPVHFHSADISGVMYLKTPEVTQTELEKTYISGRHAGYINFINSGKQRYSKSIISFEPKVGDLYISLAGCCMVPNPSGVMGNGAQSLSTPLSMNNREPGEPNAFLPGKSILFHHNRVAM